MWISARDDFPPLSAVFLNMVCVCGGIGRWSDPCVSGNITQLQMDPIPTSKSPLDGKLEQELG